MHNFVKYYCIRSIKKFIHKQITLVKSMSPSKEDTVSTNQPPASKSQSASPEKRQPIEAANSKSKSASPMKRQPQVTVSDDISVASTEPAEGLRSRILPK